MIEVPKEASSIPALTMSPPMITTGLLPKRFTSMLLKGPGRRRGREGERGLSSRFAQFAAAALNVPLTSCVHRSKHDRGNPGYLAVGNRKVCLDLLVVDREGLGEGVGEAYGDESAQDDGPAPASIGWRVA